MDINQQKVFLESLKDKSDRELMEKQTLYLRMKQRDTERIKNNVVFFFWVSIVGLCLMALSIVNALGTAKSPY